MYRFLATPGRGEQGPFVKFFEHTALFLKEFSDWFAARNVVGGTIRKFSPFDDLPSILPRVRVAFAIGGGDAPDLAARRIQASAPLASAERPVRIERKRRAVRAVRQARQV
jgi:hypothetical protein